MICVANGDTAIWFSEDRSIRVLGNLLDLVLDSRSHEQQVA
jgi:hypothetical protein